VHLSLSFCSSFGDLAGLGQGVVACIKLGAAPADHEDELINNPIVEFSSAFCIVLVILLPTDLFLEKPAL
jgi:hypothetical protein